MGRFLVFFLDESRWTWLVTSAVPTGEKAARTGAAGRRARGRAAGAAGLCASGEPTGGGAQCDYVGKSNIKLMIKETPKL
jgi:hypothetical protein